MTEIGHRYVESASGLRMHVAEYGEGPLVLLLHGFPECWYSWRHQLLALADAGFHAVAPDQRGYARTGGPEAADQYSILHLVSDAVGLIDALGEETAVVAGHDWGAPVAWATAQFRPDKVRGVIGLSVPHRPRSSGPPVEAMRTMLGDGFYMVHFQRPDVPEAELGRDPEATFRRMLYAGSGDGPGLVPIVPEGGGFLDVCAEPDALPGWLTEDDIAAFAAEYRESGFSRPAQLVPQPRPQLGAHRRLAPRADHPMRRSSWRATATWSSPRPARWRASSGWPTSCPACARSSGCRAAATGRSRSVPPRSTTR